MTNWSLRHQNHLLRSKLGIVCEEMENAMSLLVPLRTEAGIGDNWMIAK